MATEVSDEIKDFTNKIKDRGHSSAKNASDAQSDFDFDSVLNATNTALDLIGPLTSLVDFLDGAAAMHPYVSIAVGPFKVLVNLELKRRSNNKKVDVLYNRMGSMMASLKPLLESDHKDMTKILPLLDQIGKDLSECGNMLDVFKKQVLIVRFFKSTSWEDKMVEFADKFIQRQRDIGLCLTVTVHLATARIEDAITQIHDMMRQQSTMEADFHRFVEAQGGVEACMADDNIFAQLVKKLGVPSETQASRRPPPTAPNYGTRIVQDPVPVYSRYPDETRPLQYRERSPPPVMIRSGYPAERPLRPSRRRSYDHRPTIVRIPEDTRRTRPSRREYSPSRRRSPSPIRRSYRRSRRLSPVIDEGGTVYVRSGSRSRSSRDNRSRSRSHSPDAIVLEDPNTTDTTIQLLKIEVTSALATDLDAIIEKNASNWAIKFKHQTRVIQDLIQSSTMQIIKAIEHGHSGQHDRVHDPQMRKLWESEKWRGSIANSTLLEGIHDYFWQFFQDALAQGDFTQPTWTLLFMEKPYWAALSEVLDFDQSGMVSVVELNHFTDRKPQDVSLTVHLAVTALKSSYDATYYKNSLVRLLREIEERLLSMSAQPNIQMASIQHEHLNDLLLPWLAGIMDPPRHISDALKHPQLFAHLEKGRLAQETYWEECLKKVHWEIDSPEILDAFSNDRPIEQYLLPLMFALLHHQLLLVKMCSVLSLDPRELLSSLDNIYQVLDVANTRVVYLEGCFAQRNDRPSRYFNFACGIFARWPVYEVEQSAEEISLENFSADLSSDELDRFREVLRFPESEPIPVTRPLPIARTSTTGELLSSSFMPLRVKAISNYIGADDKDLTFSVGDIIEVSKTSNDGWWKGRLVTGRRGQRGWRLFPANLVVAHRSASPIRPVVSGPIIMAGPTRTEVPYASY